MVRFSGSWTTVLLVSVIGTAHAKPIEVSGGLESRLSDNMTQASSSPKTDMENRVNLRVAYQSDPGKCNSALSAKLGYGHWVDKTYDPEVYTDIDFVGDCQLSKRLYWDLTNSTRDVSQDSRGGNTPDNTTRKNVFRTGPRYQLQLSPRDVLTLAAKYENTEFDEPDENDSNRVIGSTIWNHLFSTTFSGGVSLEANKVELDTTEEIDRYTASLIFDKRWVTTRLNGSIGVSKIETKFQGAETSSDAIVGDISLTRDINASASIYLQASHQLTDQSSDYDIVFQGIVFNVRESEAIEVTTLRAGLNKTTSNGSAFGLSIFADRTDYLLSRDQEDALGADARYSRPVNPWLTANVGGQYVYRSYSDDGSDDQELSIDAGLSYELTRNASVRGSVGHTQKVSDIASREYDENWIVVGIDYKFR